MARNTEIKKLGILLSVRDGNGIREHEWIKLTRNKNTITEALQFIYLLVFETIEIISDTKDMKFLLQLPCCSCFCFIKGKKDKHNHKEKEAKHD